MITKLLAANRPSFGNKWPAADTRIGPLSDVKPIQCLHHWIGQGLSKTLRLKWALVLCLPSHISAYSGVSQIIRP